MATFINNYEQNLFNSRYKQFENEQTWLDVFKRVANFVGNTEEEKELFYKSMANAEFLPSTPQLTSFGTQKSNGSSCFTGEIHDNLDSIYSADATACQVYKNSGGIGFLLDEIRPRGSKISDSKNPSVGVMSVINKLNQTTEYITAGGRSRGALMIQLSIEHPDSIEFIFSKTPMKIMVKSKDQWKENYLLPLQNCNMSIRLSDNFMKCVKNNSNWEFYWSNENNSFSITTYQQLFENLQRGINDSRGIEYQRFFDVVLKPELHNKVGKIKAKWIWEKIIENAHKHAEPGIVFSDRYDQFSPFDNKNPILSNPCFSGEMELLTFEGYKKFKDICGTEQEIVNKNGNIVLSKIWCSGEKEVIELLMEDGKILEVTPEHILMTSDEQEIKAIDSLNKELKYFQLSDNKKVVNIKSLGIQKVYDFSEPECHWGVVNNIVVHNCSEFLAPPGGACLLASVNLRKCVIDKEFNFNKLKDIIKTMALYLNEALEKTNTPVDYINKGSKEDYRQIGIGLMGLADIFLILGLRYGEEKSIKLTKDIVEEMALTAWEFSFNCKRPKPLKLIPERLIKIFNFRKDNGIQKDRWEVLINKLKNGEFPTNSAVLSIAPTGSISQIAGYIDKNQGVSSGIEPVFSFETIRSDSTGQTVIYHDLMPADKNLPQHFVSVKDIDSRTHINILAEAAKFVCMSISKTVNLPSDSTLQDVENAYWYSYELGVKGCTVYRDKSLPNQILSNIEQSNTEMDEKTIPAVRHKVTVEGTPFYIFVSTYNDKPYEIFAVTNYKKDTLQVQDSINKMLDLCLNEKIEERHVIEQLGKSKYQPRDRLTRLISLCLRQNVQVDKIIDTLESSKENTFVNLPKQIANKLKQYKTTFENCPNCKEGKIIYYGGCSKCDTCDYVGGCG